MKLNTINLRDKITPMDWSVTSIVDVVRTYCGNDFADGLEDVLIELQEQSDYVTRKLNTDLECYEMDIEQMRTGIIDATENLTNIIQQIENSKIPFSKQKIMPLIKQIKLDLEYSV